MQAEIISFRRHLAGTVNDFLQSEGIECFLTSQALVELIAGLANYQEEGVRLFPRLVICNDLDEARRLLQSDTSIELGSGPMGASSIAQALKVSAPLAQSMWNIYVHRTGTDFRYGILREPLTPVALDIRDSLTGIEGAAPTLVISQIGDKTVEAVGSRGHRLVVHLSAARTDQPSPREAVEKLAGVICRRPEGDDDGIDEALESYLRTILSTSLQHGHGALIAVLNREGGLPRQWIDETTSRVDGVILPAPLDIASAVREYRTEDSAAALSKLLSFSTLINGMLSADGITIFGSGGTLFGYNFFIRSSPQEGALARSMVGGARRRAFRALQSLVTSGDLSAALFRSSDGTTEFEGNT